MHRRSFLVALHTVLNSVEETFINDSRKSIGNKDISELVFTDVFAVGQNTEDCVIVHKGAPVFNAAAFHYFNNLADFFAIIIEREYILDNRCIVLINLKMLFVINFDARCRGPKSQQTSGRAQTLWQLFLIAFVVLSSMPGWGA